VTFETSVVLHVLSVLVFMLLPILTNIRQIKTYSSSCISWTAVTLWRLCRRRDWTQIRWCWIRSSSITTNAIGLHRSL